VGETDRVAGDGNTAATRRRSAWVGGSVAIAGILQFLPGSLDVFHLAPVLSTCASGLIVLAGLVVGELTQRAARRDADRDREAAFGAALLRWPAPALSALTHDAVGVHLPPNDLGYVDRDGDAAMAEAIRSDLMLIVFGPPGAGKTRSALEAVRRATGDDWSTASVLAPRDAAGLDRLIGERRTDVLATSTRAILWLDGLDRFLETLSIDRLEHFLTGVEQSRIVDFIGRLALIRRLLTPSRVDSLHRLVERLRPRRLARWLLRTDRTRVALVATIREDVLDELLSSPSAQGTVLRQVLMRARGLRLPDQFSPAERTRYQASRGRVPTSFGVRAAFPVDWRTGWQGRAQPWLPAVPHKPAPDWVLRWLLSALLLAVAGFVVVGEHYGWTVAKPLKQQVADLKAGGPACERLDAYPAAGAGLRRSSDPNDGVLVTVVAARDCQRSDAVQARRLGTDGRLHEVASLQPPPTPRIGFSCIATDPADPCRVTLQGDSTYIAGAFRDADAETELPAIAALTNTALRIDGLSAPADQLPRAYRDQVSADLGPRSGSVSVSPGCPAGRSCVIGRRAYVASVAPVTADHPALLLLGYPSARGMLGYRMWRLGFDAQGRPRVDTDCIVLRDGRVLRQRVRMSSPEVARVAMQPEQRRQGTQILC
jgi:hypothetical protein